ncbi:MAG: hypothetical protein M4579_005157 [Chaenotheca gracillima]|nr:MAG: hypothetical protein M4579_005157 [Chaenotheca gracillima]
MTSRKRDLESFREVSPPPLRKKQAKTAQSLPTSNQPISARDSGRMSLRIFSWNVNGVGPLIQRNITSFFGPASAKTAPIRDFLSRHGWPQLVCLQEVKIKASDEVSQRALEVAVNLGGGSDDAPTYVVRFCLPRDKFNARGFGGKLYGVACIVREDFWNRQVLRCREVDWDLEGRVLVLETRSKLAIFNIYAVNGTDSPYKNSQTGELAGTRHDRKLQFHKHLLDECRALEKRGFALALAGDFNIARTALDAHPTLRTSPQHVLNRADFNKKFIDEGLRAVDTFRHLHGSQRKFTYYPRGRDWGSGCDRVDLILISNLLKGSLLEADMLDSPAERGPSDHVPLFVTITGDQEEDSKNAIVRGERSPQTQSVNKSSPD